MSRYGFTRKIVRGTVLKSDAFASVELEAHSFAGNPLDCEHTVYAFPTGDGFELSALCEPK